MKIDAINAVTTIESSRRPEKQMQDSSLSCRQSETPINSASHFEMTTEDGNEIVYRAVDPETGLVLAQVPSEEVLRVARKLEELKDKGKIG